MKKTLLLLAFAPFTAHAQLPGLALGDLMNTSNLSPLEAAAATVIAQLLGIKPQSVLQQVQPYGVSVYDSAPAWYISHETNRPFRTIWEMKQSGKGWGVIAKEMGMHPGTFNKMRKAGAFNHYSWIRMTDRYSVTNSDWSRYSGRGIDDRDVIIASVMGNGDHNRFVNVLRSRTNSGYWTVPGHGRVTATEAWGRKNPPVKTIDGVVHTAKKANGSGKAKVQGSGNGQGNGNKNVSGNGKVKGNGGNSGNKGKKGSGNGKGKGHGG